MSLMFKYYLDFDDIVKITLAAIRKKVYVAQKVWQIQLYDYVGEIVTQYDETLSVSANDVAQELAACWMKFQNEFYTNKPAVHIRQYLIMRSVWALRDWVSKLCGQSFIPTQYLHEHNVYDIEEWGFNLDIKFLIHGTGWYPLSLLSPYERYLIFLRFVEDKSIKEIGYIVQKDRLTVSKQLDEIINDFRSRLNVCKQKDSSRSCS